MTFPDLLVSRLSNQIWALDCEPYEGQSGTGGQVLLPAPGKPETDDEQDQVGDLEAEQQPSQAVFILEASLAQAQGTLEISEHFLPRKNTGICDNPEAFLVPGDRLLGVAEGSAQIPEAGALATDDEVQPDGVPAAILDLGEQEGCPFEGIEIAQRKGTTSVVDQGAGAETDDEGEVALLEPADQFRFP